ncbi:glycosyltransferase family 25 protein [Parasulfuritortus cantonensis]|uniref:Glycosyltransferase family 25 protein n=1 Tax=Parasulfuritortus cantonensis TaxID=2528202 RepID=A0A4R1B193_9PROT|nr:glycosyltransferase family 25 protein [Parasulfuritortus cantonensis]TCJ11764.1 glycosyltransferase family 25 protein [Parasulfuritortus cantonensis]
MRIPIYLINLDQRPDRLAAMQERLRGLVYTRVPAFDGNRLAADALAGREVSAKLTRNEIGCYLSHEAVWRDVVEKRHPLACVLEDDVVFSREFADFMASGCWADLDFDLVKLDNWPGEIVLSRLGRRIRHRAVYRIRSTTFSAACYLVSARGAAKLLREGRTLRHAVDILQFATKSPWLLANKVYQLSPAIAAQEQLVTATPSSSDIEASRIEARRRRKSLKRRGLARVVREVERIYRQARALPGRIASAVKNKRREIGFD